MHIRQSLLPLVVASLILLSPLPGAAQDEVSYQLADGHKVAPLEHFQECVHCPEMIVIPLGLFMMGAVPGESSNPFEIYGEKLSDWRRRGPDELNIIPHEHPRHPVEMDISYAIARNEVTQAEWVACVNDGGCSHMPDHRVLRPSGYVKLGPGHPIVDVSYLDALEYVAWLNNQVGAEVYRLPTEAEWEYAARAGTTTRYAQGEELSAEQANFLGRATERTRGIKMPHLVDRDTPVPVDELDAANAWGVRHMSGNVYEVTQSCWTAKHLGLPTDSDYLDYAQSQDTCRRVAKGGSFTSGMDNLRLAVRMRPEEIRRRDFIGFRIVRELPEIGDR